MPKCTAVRRPFRIRSSVVYGGSSMEKKHVWLTWIQLRWDAEGKGGGQRSEVRDKMR